MSKNANEKSQSQKPQKETDSFDSPTQSWEISPFTEALLDEIENRRSSNKTPASQSNFKPQPGETNDGI